LLRSCFTADSTLLARPHQGGRFGLYDTEQTALALACYGVGLTAYAGGRLLWTAFYALSDARTPMYISLVSVAGNIDLPFILIRGFHHGFAALALTTSFAAIVECLLLGELLRRKLGGLEGRYLFSVARRLITASILVTGPILSLRRTTAGLFDATRPGYLLQIALCVPVIAAAFWFADKMFGIEERHALKQMFICPLQERWAVAHAKIRD
jgi:putative peptidoglycan lipid II flippase